MFGSLEEGILVYIVFLVENDVWNTELICQKRANIESRNVRARTSGSISWTNQPKPSVENTRSERNQLEHIIIIWRETA